MKLILYQWLGFIILSTIMLGCEGEKKEFIQPSPKVETPGEITSNSFLARWASFPSVDYYLFDIALDADFKTKLSDEYPIAVKDNFYEVQYLAPSTVYYYRVGAKTISGSTIDYSLTQQAATTSLPSPVAYEPANIRIDQITALWSEVKEADAYQIEVSKDIDFNVVLNTYIKTDQKDTLLVIDKLEAHQGYFYRVKSKQGEFTSLPSNTIYSTTTNLEKPSFTGTPEVYYTSISFQWNQVNFAEAYEVEVCTDPLFDINSAPVIKLENVPTAQATVEGLKANTYYYYRVRARQGEVFSSYSSTSKIKTQSLEVPVLISPNDINTNQFTASWGAVAGAEAYEFDLATDIDFKSTLAQYRAYSLSELSFLITDLTPNTLYYLRVRAVGFNAFSDYSDVMTISTAQLIAPTTLEVISKSINSFTLSWDIVEGAESYILSIATDSTFTEYFVGYEQKEIIGNEWNVENIDPLQNYFVSVKSKHDELLSPEETIISVEAPIPSGCVLSKRIWDDGWVESYTYNNDQLLTINGDSAGIARYSWELIYAGEQLIKANKYEDEALNLLVLHEVWLFGYQDTLWTSLHRQDENANTLDYTTLIYDASGKLVQVNKYADAQASILLTKENYTYTEERITEARDNTNQLIKSWKYENYYNPAYQFSPETHALLYDPGKSSTLGFVSSSVPSFYQQFVIDHWEKQAYVYEANNVGMPIKAYSGSAVPSHTYIFEACGF